jgi:two-component system sensor histidine kinase QseC
VAKAQAITTMMTPGEDTVSVDLTDRFIRGFGGNAAKDFFELRRADGTSLQRSAALGNAHLPDEAGPLTKPRRWSFVLPNGQPGRAVGVEFSPVDARGDGGTGAPRYRLVVATDRAGLDEDLWEIFSTMAGTGLFVLVLTLWLVPLALRRGLRPLVKLENEVAQIDAETLGRRISTEGVPEELATVTTRLNALLLRLEQSFERERRVSAALAHELRTPIAELRTLADSALKWPDARDPETDRDALAIARQMESIVTHMLTMARSESGQMTLQHTAVRLDEEVTRAWRAVADRAAVKGCTCALETAPMAVESDAVLVRSILNNLLENAVEYSPAGSEISVSLAVAANGFRLAVSNLAPDLDQADVGHLFERFWRKEQARSGGLHAGLGLSLVNSFARALGWNVTAELRAGSRLTLTVVPRPPIPA